MRQAYQQVNWQSPTEDPLDTTSAKAMYGNSSKEIFIASNVLCIYQYALLVEWSWEAR